MSAVGEQYVAAAAAQRRRPVAEGRRRDPAGPHHGAARHQHAAGRHQPRPAGDPARQPEDRHRRGLRRGRRARPGASPAWSTGSTTLAIDARKNLDSADHADRPVQAGAGHPDRHRGRRSRRGRRTWRPSPASCRRQDAAVAGILRQRARRRRRGAGSCSTGCSPRCRSCWPTWSASARWPSPTSRASNSCWCCCRRAPPSRRPSACQARTPSRTTRATPWFNLNLAIPLLPTSIPLPPQPAAALHDRLPARPAAAGRPASRTIPDRPPGDLYCRVPQDCAVQRARRAQPAVRDRAGQTRADGEVVRERRAVRAAQRRLQLEGRPQRDTVGPGRPAVAARRRHLRKWPRHRVRCRRRSRPPNTTRQPARTLDRTGTSTHSPIWPATPQRSKHGRRCCCPRRGAEQACNRAGGTRLDDADSADEALELDDVEAEAAEADGAARGARPRSRHARRCRTFGWRPSPGW